MNLALIWITEQHTDVPHYLRYLGFERLIDNHGRNLAMTWVTHTRLKLPEYLCYPNFEYHIDKYGNDICLLWTKSRTSLIPRHLRYVGFEKIKDSRGAGHLPYWFSFDQLDKTPPKYLLYKGWEALFRPGALRKINEKYWGIRHNLRQCVEEGVANLPICEKNTLILRLSRPNTLETTFSLILKLVSGCIEIGSSQ